MLKDNYDGVKNKLLNENFELRNTLLGIQQEINHIIRYNKEEFVIKFDTWIPKFKD